MAKSTGIVLATGAITVVNQSVFHDRPVDWRIPVATGLAAMGFSLAEKAWQDGVVLLAWTGLITILFTRTQSSVPSPVESALKWWDEGGK